MTSLIHETNRPQKASPNPAPALLADKIGIGIAVACTVLAIVLAFIEVSSEMGSGAALDLPPLTPLAEGSYWTGFSA
jgi:hypothetical protein